MRPDPESDDADALEMLEAAEQNFRGLIRMLVEIQRRLEAGEILAPDAEVRRAMSGVNKAIQVVFDERRKLDEIRRSHAGPARSDALDIREAESEVRRRMARIRAALGDGNLPANPD